MKACAIGLITVSVSAQWKASTCLPCISLCKSCVVLFALSGCTFQKISQHNWSLTYQYLSLLRSSYHTHRHDNALGQGTTTFKSRHYLSEVDFSVCLLNPLHVMPLLFLFYLNFFLFYLFFSSLTHQLWTSHAPKYSNCKRKQIILPKKTDPVKTLRMTYQSMIFYIQKSFWPFVFFGESKISVHLFSW